jgi:hypothetical protein
MKKSDIFAVLCMILLNIQACKVTDNKKPNYQYVKVKDQVKELYLSTIDAFNDRNLDLFLANFAPKIKMYGTDGTYFGQDALRARFEILFKQFPNAKMDIPELESEVLSNNVVLVNFKWKVYPMGQGPAFTGLGSGIYTYADGKWMEILEVETITDVDEALKRPE